jgi:predicted CoA-binding protein
VPIETDEGLRELLERVRSIAVVEDRCLMVEHARLLGSRG